MPITIHPGAKIVLFGDSLTNGFGGTAWQDGGFTSTVTAAFGSPSNACTNSATSCTNSATSCTYRSPIPTVIVHGHNSAKISTLQGLVASEVIALNPTHVFIQGTGTDMLDGTGYDQYQTDATALLTTIKAGLPSAQVAWLNIWNYGEWQAGAAEGEPFYGYITLYNARIPLALAAVDASYVYIDIRAARDTYEAAHNTPYPGVSAGIMTIETPPAYGAHCNASAGAPNLSTTVLASVTFVTP